MESQAKRIENTTQKTLLRTIAIAAFCVVFIIILIATQYDTEKRTIELGFFLTFSNILITLATLYVAWEYFLMSRRLLHFAGEVKISPIPILGISMIIVAVCFFWQFLIDFIAVFGKGVLLLEQADPEKAKITLFTVFGEKNGIAAICVILGFLSGVAFLIDGLSMWLQKKECPFWLRLVPPIWAGVSLLYVMVSYPSIVSAQSDVSKVFSCVITILFLLYNATEICKTGERKSREFSAFIRLSYPILIFLTAAPYGFSMLFFTKGETVNIPHIAYAGLFIYGTLASIQFIIQAIHQIKKGVRVNRTVEPQRESGETISKEISEKPIDEQEKVSSTDNSVEWSYFEE